MAEKMTAEQAEMTLTVGDVVEIDGPTAAWVDTPVFTVIATAPVLVQDAESGGLHHLDPADTVTVVGHDA